MRGIDSYFKVNTKQKKDIFDAESNSNFDFNLLKIKNNSKSKVEFKLKVESDNNSKSKEIKVLKKKEESIYVYTDGACSNNGKKNSKAGIGIWFGDNDIRNVSECVKGSKQTNNVAELLAIYKVYNILKEEIESNKKISIYSDSIYAIRCCTTYGIKLYNKKWVLDKPIPNFELVKKTFLLYHNKNNIKFIYIKAHSGKKDIHSIGNEHADLLATSAIKDCSNTMNNNQDDEEYIYDIFLNVPYDSKDYAKSLGARWNPSRKKWYVKSNFNSEKKEKLIKLYS